MHLLLSYDPSPSFTPYFSQHVYLEALSTIHSNRPCAAMPCILFEKLTMGAEKNAARGAMYQAEETHLREAQILDT